MGRITADMTIADRLAAPGMEPYAKYMLYAPVSLEGEDRMKGSSLRSLAAIGWSPEGIAAGAECFLDAAAQGRVSLHPLYAPEECADDPNKKDVSLIRIFPERPDPSMPAVVLCAGGGYKAVCTLAESLPTARHMLGAGCTVYVLTYRVSVPRAALAALDDLARAVGWLEERAKDPAAGVRRYAIGGYSAGANLVSNWGCPSIGWKRYGRTKPVCMFPIYTYIDLGAEYQRDESGGILRVMFGDGWRETYGRFNVPDLIDPGYPPCYIVCGRDDAVVSCRHSELMKEKLDEAGVPAVLEEKDRAAHGFGDGTGTQAEGWPQRALAFMESLRERA